MSEKSEIETAIDTAAVSPAEVAVDGTRTKARPIGELIEADKYAKKCAAQRAMSGIGIRRINSRPGATA